ncbi:MAG: putative baseplate assembly protein [bacterium]
MPLPSPILDDRSYQQLRDELVRRIPVYAPEWTDHNPSDPGITLVELFAFLGENLLFRFNQIPETTKLAYLKLLRVPMRAAVPARAMIVLERTDSGPGSADGVIVDLGTEAKAGSVPYETTTEVVAWPLTAVAVARIAAPEPTQPEAIDFANASIDALDGLGDTQEPAYYTTEHVPADPSDPSAMPVNVRSAVDGALWIALLKTKTTDITKLGRALINIGFVPDEEIVGIADVDACPGVMPSDNGPEMIWQVSTPTVSAGVPRFQTLALEGDTTRGLTQQGVLRLRLPLDTTTIGVPDPGDEYLLGTGSFPPPLEDDEQAKNLICWIRASRRATDRPIGRVLYVGVNATEVLQARTAKTEFLAVGTGDAGQSYPLVNHPVLARTAEVQVEEDGRWVDWDEVDGFEASTSDSRQYVLDAEAGTVRFGNGVRGRAPQIGQRIRVRKYRYGGGAEGNVGAKAIAKLDGLSQVKANNPLPARGGAPAESIGEALERVPGELRRHDRAVTMGDFQELALATPGADVGRADCLPLFRPPKNLADLPAPKPSAPFTEAAGVVSVVVWPREDRQRPNAPMASRTLLREVCEYLDARRLVTTELYVIPPTYRKIAVAVGLRAKPGYGIEAVRRWVELVLRQYLAPLPPYGPDGHGWPLGRAVYGPELEAAALQVEGVELLEGLSVSAWNEATQTWNAPRREPVLLQAWEVPELSEITVVQGTPLVPGEALGPVLPSKTPVPIPTLREEC